MSKLTNTDVQKMAEEASFIWDELGLLDRLAFYKFADLVATAENEACAKVCEELDKKSADGEWGDYLAGWSDGTDDCAVAIRELHVQQEPQK
jgi:hypothetical protein